MASVFAVCGYCATTLVRRDVNLETYGKMAELPYDMSPFQLGTQGLYDGKPFELVGRLKVSWENGTWNEWYVVFNEGRTGWLGEAMGFYMLGFERPDVQVPDRSRLTPGATVTLDREDYHLDDMREVECIGSEGELPFFAAQGRRSFSVDLSGPEGEFASIEYAAAETRIYIGRYVEFDELKLKNLRELDGW